MPIVCTPKSLSHTLGVRTVDILKEMIKMGLEPKSAEEILDTNVSPPALLLCFALWRVLLVYVFQPNLGDFPVGTSGFRTNLQKRSFAQANSTCPA